MSTAGREDELKNTISNDNDFFRLKNLGGLQIPLSQSRADRKRTITSTFTEQIDAGAPSDKLGRVYLQPSNRTIKLPNQTELLRRKKRFSGEPSILSSVFKDLVEPCGGDPFLLTGQQKRTKLATSPQESVLPSPSKSREIKVQEFADSQTNLPGNLICAEWNCDGSLCVICCHQGVALANPFSMSFMASSPGPFCRIACHPIVPNLFSALLSSNSIGVYEVSQKQQANRPSGTSTCVIKLIADIKLKNSKLSGSLLCWDPSGRYIVSCRHDLQFLVVAYRSSTKQALPVASCLSPESPVVGNPGLASAPVASAPVKETSRSELKVVAQERLEHRAHAATFLKRSRIKSAPSDRSNEDPGLASDTGSCTYTYLCFAQTGGNITIYQVNTNSTNVLGSSNAKLLSLPWSFQCSWDDLVSIEADPNGRFLIVGGEDSTISVIDVDTKSTVSTIHRAFGPVKHLSLNPSGSFVVWSAEVSQTLSSGPALDSGMKSLMPFLSIATTQPLDILWKMKLPAALKSLSWHPLYPVVLYTYESYAYTRPMAGSSVSSWAAIDRDKANALGTEIVMETPKQGVGMLSLSQAV